MTRRKSPWQDIEPGDLLYVRESWAKTSIAPIVETIDNPVAVYRECDNRCDYGGPWKPSIHMPRWASRLTLQVTEKRIQRLQEITAADAEAEGIEDRRTGGLAPLWRVYGQPPKRMRGLMGVLTHNRGQFATDARDSFATLWNSLNEQRGFGWEVNPEVVAISFEVHRANVDTLPISGRVRPILFSAAMVRALLEGRKTQTRRLAWRGRE